MYLILKRIFDVVLSTAAFIVLLPLLVVVSLLIKMESKGPVLFIQKRVGVNKTHFNILKFRTMYTETPNEMPTHLLDNPQRFITRFGKIWRRTSIDELPQLWNIIVGDMSIVGPRPALWNQFDLIAERDKYGANDVKPGLTGWAQVNGRDTITIEEKAAYDGEYVRSMGFLFDVKCIVRTVFSISSGADIVLERKDVFDTPDEQSK